MASLIPRPNEPRRANQWTSACRTWLRPRRARLASRLDAYRTRFLTRRVPWHEVLAGEWEPLRLVTTDWKSLDIRGVLWVRAEEALRASRSTSGAPDRRRLGFTSSRRLASLADAAPPAPPRAFIFHIGKCGSTLLRNMLDAHPDVRALLEPAIFVQILCSFARSPRDADTLRDQLARAAVHAFANAMRPPDRHLFIKLASVCYVAMPRMRNLFPGVPQFAIFREPRSLIAAHLRSPVIWGGLRALDPGAVGDCRPELDQLSAELYGTTWEEARATATDEFIARTIGHYYRRVLAMHDDLVIPIGYEALKDPETLRAMLQRCDIRADEASLASMLGASRHHSKDDSKRSVFTHDQRAGLDAARLDRLVDRWIAEPYRDLQARSAQMLGTVEVIS